MAGLRSIRESALSFQFLHCYCIPSSDFGEPWDPLGRQLSFSLPILRCRIGKSEERELQVLHGGGQFIAAELLTSK